MAVHILVVAPTIPRGGRKYDRNARKVRQHVSAPTRRGRRCRAAPTAIPDGVRVRDGKTLVTDGPFTETKEAVGGFDLLECGSLEEAVEIAATHPLAQMGAIEVRPLWGN